MKHLLIPFIFGIFLSNCDNGDDAPKKDALTGTWNVQHISGGFAGIDDDYESGVIVWAFSAENGTLNVENKNEADVIYDGFPTGSYSYAILTVEGEQFLEIDGQEQFGIVLSSGQMLLDANKTSTGMGADGFQIVLVP
ncbi:hypothetical protein J0X14_12595 [Muricauda sp. CAU 1633]|uniref:hypothetical protein n=1 Tax=Allomuricauda sp. CAU 1633 TaxID=2816036 RepID=UPI001A8F598D|nr:hypothetical protein [Muricauda sp. CAU 1633]MBO0323138.1 hypothetical protein [Muricauda sp. CAU 1633]